MAKVLISFIGTAQPKEREYKSAMYRFPDGREYNDKFIAHSLYQHYGIDRLILIGTAHSMWEEVYYKFAQERGLFDEKIYFKIGEYCINADHNTSLDIPHLNDIDNALGDGGKAILIRYGLNEAELQENAGKILGIEQYLSAGDELYVDVTHSFRSLPLFLMNTLVYLQNVSTKKINIKHISYGMLDITRELGYTPVVELNSIMKINQWITGAYAFTQFGNAYQIADLLEEENEKDVANRLRDFSNEMNLNHLDGVRTQSNKLSAIKNRTDFSPIPNTIIPTAVNSYIKALSVGNSSTPNAAFQYKIACWQYEHKNYASAYLSLLESLLTYVQECCGYDEGNSVDNAEKGKLILKGDKSEKANSRKVPGIDQCIIVYKDINHIRNTIAHQINHSRGADNCTTLIRKLEGAIILLKPIFK